MKDKHIYAHEIDSYLSGEMKPAEREAFEKELQLNRELNKEYLLEKDIRNVLSKSDEIEFRQKLNSVIYGSKNKTRIIPMFRKKWHVVAAAASVIILLGLAVQFLIPSSYSNDKLFSMYYDSENSLHVERSGDGNLVEALRFYQQRNYANALKLFTQILEKDPMNIAIRFYSGISYIEIEEFDEAISAFQYIINDDNNLYIEPAHWYLGLCYLKDNRTDAALKQFTKIASESTNYYQKDASRIIDQINKE